MHPRYAEIAELLVERPGTLSLRSDGLAFEDHHALMRDLGHRLTRVEFYLQGVGEEHDAAMGRAGAYARLGEAVRHARSFGVPVWAMTRIDAGGIDRLRDWIVASRELGFTENHLDAAVDGEGRALLDGDGLRAAVDAIVEVRGRTGLPSIHYGYGLAGPGGIDFCPYARGYDPLVGPDGSLSFCGHGPLLGGTFSVASLGVGGDGLAAGLAAVVERSAALRGLRIDAYEAGEITDGFDRCEFCRASCAEIGR